MTSVGIKGLIKDYGAFQAVKAIDLEVKEGELVVLLGPSGCGKTTTLRCIAGLENVNGGEIRLGDQLVSSAQVALPPEQRTIGMVFQSYAVWPHMTIYENVAFGLRLKKLPKNEISARVDKVLDMVGLGALGSRSVSQLSGGQQQRVALARAIVLEPRVLLFDEPLSNLDAKLRERMRYEVRSLQKRLGITSVYVTHDQQEAMAIADRIVLMNSGVIEQVGSPAEIYDRPVSHFAAEFIGLANFMTGKVVETSPTRVQLDNGLMVTSTDVGVVVGDKVEAIVRPEAVRLRDGPPDGVNSFAAKVVSCIYLGNMSDLILDVGGMQVRCQSSPPMMYPVGHEVTVQFAPERVVVLKASEQAPAYAAH